MGGQILGGKSGVFLWGSGSADWVASLTPETLAGYHPLWANDVDVLGPWSMLEKPLLGPGETHVLWRATQCESDDAVLVCGRCPSSMDVAWHLDGAGVLPDWSSVVAVEQVAGRGRWQRHWVSTPGNLHVSWVWPKGRDDEGSVLGVASLLSLVVGYMLACALEAYNLDVQIKWPNDLFWNGRKIGGILIEQRNQRTLVGLGLNLVSAPPDKTLEREGAPSAVSLSQAGVVLPPLSGWLALARLAKGCMDHQLKSLAPEAFIALLEERLVGIGQTVLVQPGKDDPYRARITGLAPDGGLILERKAGRSVLYSGRIRLS